MSEHRDEQRPADADRSGPARRTDALRAAADLLTVRRAFGEPIVQDPVTLVPVARVTGGAGAGWGTGTIGETDRGEGAGEGGGGGYGVRVRPLGAYVVDGTKVTWQPALDLGRVILGGQVVGAVAVFALAWAWRTHRRLARTGRRP